MSTFSGNVNLLVAAPMLQDFLVDKDGTAMSAGKITCYHDNSRTTLKNWYYQTGTPGAYTYTALPNPLTLSAAGTICDVNGVDTIPFFYPVSETDSTKPDPYYITIVNHAQTNQITRANFPFVSGSGGNVTTTDSFNNLIVNGGFYRNLQPNNLAPGSSNTSVNLSSSTQIVVAPSQHDGFQYPDIQFFKTNTSGTDAVTFIPFPLGSNVPVTNFVSTEYYLSHDCSGANTGNTQKCYQFPISLHINSLANQQYTVSIQAQNGGASPATISLYMFQDTGSGTSAPSPVIIGQIALSTTWTTYTFTSVFPATTGLTLSKGSDDALYLQVQMPLNAVATVNFTKPSIYLTNNIIPNNDYQTYDQVDSIINSPRTGDIRVSVNPFYNSNQKWIYGWVPMNDGTIGNPSSSSTTRANSDTWQLFSMLWNLAKPYDSGSNSNPICQLYTSAGSATNYGGSAIADFNANRRLAITRMIGKVMLGSVPLSALLAATPTILGQSSVVTDSSSSGLLFTTSASNLLNLFLGNTVTFQNTGGALNSNIIANFVYYVVPISTTTFKVAVSFAAAMAGTVVGFGTPGTGTTTAYLQYTGSSEGEYAHTQLMGELAAHNHTPLTIAGTFMVSGAGTADVVPGGVIGTNAFTSTTGSSTPFNVTQPGTFYNMFIKL
jgi:hypothetical protein